MDPDTLLKSSAGTGRNKEHRRRYGVMVVAQIAFALPVLIGSVLLIESVVFLHDRDRIIGNYGYDVMSMATSYLPVRIDSTQRSIPVMKLDDELRTHALLVPGVSDVAISMFMKPDRVRGTPGILVDDPDGSVREISASQWGYQVVSSTTLRTFGYTVVKGRDFDASDVERPGLIIDPETALYLWRNSNPIGRSIKLGNVNSNAPWLRVIGVVSDKRDSATVRRNDPYYGFHLGVIYRAVSRLDTIRNPYIVQMFAHVNGNVDLAAVRLQRELRAMSTVNDPTVEPASTGQYGLRTWQAKTDFVAALFTTFAFIGVCLVAIGVAGIVMHSVAERRRELAVRISLGATARDVLRTVLREGNVLILAGTAIGLELARRTIVWVGQFVQDPDGFYDAFGFALVAASLFALAVLSALIPAWRATRIDPAEALRHE